MWEPLQAAVSEGRVTLVTIASISSLRKPSHTWLVELYARWERNRYLTPNSLLQDIDVAACGGEKIVPLGADEVEQLAAELANFGANVLLVTPEADQASLDGIGIPTWKIQFGTTKRQQNSPGLWEVVERSLSTVSLVETSVSQTSSRVLEAIIGRTDPRSWIRNQAGLAAKASDLLRRWIPPQTYRVEHIKPRPGTEVHSRNGASGKSGAVLGLLARFGKHAGESAFNVAQ